MVLLVTPISFPASVWVSFAAFLAAFRSIDVSIYHTLFGKDKNCAEKTQTFVKILLYITSVMAQLLNRDDLCRPSHLYICAALPVSVIAATIYAAQTADYSFLSLLFVVLGANSPQFVADF